MDLDYIHHHRSNILELPEDEDTAFYAELTRQILLLMDEDDESHIAMTNRKGESPEFQGRPVVSSGNYFSWSEGGRSLEVPGWMERLWASNGGTGTGVFIPRVVVAGKTRRRRHNKPRRNDGGRTHSYAGQKSHG